MNSRGQAALEYLMTYGWALIVIAIVVGVLVFIVSSPAGNVVCNSSDPAKINVKASNLVSTVAGSGALGTIKLTNLTGGNVTAVVCNLNTTGALTSPTCSASYTSGEEISLSITATATAGTYSTSGFVFTYADYAGLDRNATVTCSGPIVVS